MYRWTSPHYAQWPRILDLESDALRDLEDRYNQQERAAQQVKNKTVASSWVTSAPIPSDGHTRDLYPPSLTYLYSPCSVTSITSSTGEGVESGKYSFTVGRGCKLVQWLWKSVWWFLRKLGINSPQDPVIWLLVSDWMQCLWWQLR